MRTQSSLFATTSASRSLAILCLLVQHCTSFLTPFTPQKLSLLSPNVGAHSRVRRGPGIAALASRRLIVTKEDRCFYKELGVKRGAKNEDIRKAFLLLAKKHHPDVSQDPDSLQSYYHGKPPHYPIRVDSHPLSTSPISLAACRFQALSRAYEVLSDSETRKEYDSLTRWGGVGRSASVLDHSRAPRPSPPPEPRPDVPLSPTGRKVCCKSCSRTMPFSFPRSQPLQPPPTLL
eukprot:1883021-Rhodomonas_salina.1